MTYLKHLWSALCGRIAPRIAELEARVAAFEAKAKRDFETRRAAQRNRTKPATTNGATQ
jgi:hypothetical protein